MDHKPLTFPNTSQLNSLTPTNAATNSPANSVRRSLGVCSGLENQLSSRGAKTTTPLNPPINQLKGEESWPANWGISHPPNRVCTRQPTSTTAKNPHKFGREIKIFLPLSQRGANRQTVIPCRQWLTATATTIQRGPWLTLKPTAIAPKKIPGNGRSPCSVVWLRQPQNPMATKTPLCNG